MFLLIGFRVRVGDLVHSWLAIVAAYLAVTVGRAVVVIGVSGLLRATRQGIPPSWATVLTWGGLRGGLSMVLALSLPTTLPHRDFLVTTTFGVVILSILVQGLTMTPLLRRLGVVRRDETRARYDRVRARIQTANAALAELAEMARRRYAPHSVLTTLQEEYEAQVQEAESEARSLHSEADHLRADELRNARRHPLVFAKISMTLSLMPFIATPELVREAFFSSDVPDEQLLEYWKQMQDDSFLAFLDMVALDLPKPAKVKTPLLVLGAARDNMIAPSEIEATARAFDTKAEIIPDVAHNSMLELRWQSVADRILSWLEDCPDRRMLQH